MTFRLLSLHLSALTLGAGLLSGVLAGCEDSGGSAALNVGELGGVVDTLRLTRVLEGLVNPTFATPLPGTDTLLVVQQDGLIRRVQNAQLDAEPFLDLSQRITAGGERGLLGLAFHPRFSENGRFYVNYTAKAVPGTDIEDGDTVVSEFQRSSQGNTGDAASERRLLTVSQPFPNHNGGMIAFSPRDGFLYIGMGDGGSGGDPQDNGQNLDTLLGKMLRIDVDARDRGEYGIPAGNMTGAGVRPEIWSYGLRNPWRFSFDENGDLYIADVGQNDIEEVDYEPAGEGGRNYGWDNMEGSECFEPISDCARDGITLPVVEYHHDAGNSITGGYVYRGQAIPELRGVYFYADYDSGLIGSLRIENGALVGARNITSSINPDRVGRITTFGLDAQGELYVLTGGGNGALYRIEAR